MCIFSCKHGLPSSLNHSPLFVLHPWTHPALNEPCVHFVQEQRCPAVTQCLPIAFQCKTSMSWHCGWVHGGRLECLWPSLCQKQDTVWKGAFYNEVFLHVLCTRITTHCSEKASQLLPLPPIMLCSFPHTYIFLLLIAILFLSPTTTSPHSLPMCVSHFIHMHTFLYNLSGDSKRRQPWQNLERRCEV